MKIKGIIYAILISFTITSATTTIASDSSDTIDGLWQGHFDINGSGHYDFTSLQFNGVAVGYSEKAKTVWQGYALKNGLNYNSEVVMFVKDGTKFSTATIQGKIDKKNPSIEAQFKTSPANDEGNISLRYNKIFERNSSMQTIQGNWEYASDDILLQIEISESGAFKGADTLGCNFYGDVSLLDKNINAYSVNLEIASCNTADGHYKGMVYLSDLKEKNDTFHLAVFGDLYGLYYPLIRRKD